MITKRRDIVGNIDDLSHGFLRGWVVDLNNKTARQSLDVFAGDEYIGTAACGFHRPDLEALGYGDGRHEFLFPLDLSSPVDPAALCARVTGAPNIVFRPNRETPEVSPRQTLREIRRQYFRSRIAALTRDPDCNAPARCRDGALVRASEVFGIPLSQFAIHVSRKFGYDISDRKDFDKFVTFYFEKYSPYRAPFRVPLAEAEIQYWLAAQPHAGSRAASHFAPGPGTSPTARTLEWILADARRLNLDDVVDPRPETTEVPFPRKASSLSRHQAFPLNEFLRYFGKRKTLLERRFAGLEDRRAVYAAAILEATRHPWLWDFLPSEWVEKLLKPAADGKPPIAEILTNEIGHPPDIEIPGPGVNNPQATRINSDRSKTVVDIQVVGPFDRILGLSESCRRFAAAVAASGYSFTFVNYSITTTSPVDGRNHVPEMLAPAKITILHLNLEEIPEALAFALTSLRDSYLIAVPYYELNTTAACHELAFELIDEIWVTTAFLKGVFTRSDTEPYLLPLPKSDATDLSREDARQFVLSLIAQKPSTTVFLTTIDALSWAGRKNTWGVIKSFQDAFPSDDAVSLIIKSINIESVGTQRERNAWAEILSQVREDHRITLLSEVLDRDKYVALLNGVDCLVSLHRSEGLGLDILDAMAFGTSVIATAYSGPTDICDETTSWPVTFDPVEVGADNYPFSEPHHTWAEPRLDSAVSAMREVHRRPDERMRRAANAQRRVAMTNNIESTTERIRSRIQEILAER